MRKSSACAVPVKSVQPCASTSVALMDWDLYFLLCLSVFCPKPSVAEVGSAPARIIAVLGYPACALGLKRVFRWRGGSPYPRRCWVCTPLLGMKPQAQYRRARCVPGACDGRVLNCIIAIWNEDPLSSHPFQILLFLQGENNLHNGCWQILQILFQGDVMMKLR